MTTQVGGFSSSPILFYGTGGEFGFLSNFYVSPFSAHGILWPTVEHYFQAMKAEPRQWTDFAALSSPGLAKKAGRSVAIGPSWDYEKVDYMLFALLRKFRSHPALRERLKATGNADIHEDSPTDLVWGWRNGGQDLLGKCLVATRGLL